MPSPGRQSSVSVLGTYEKLLGPRDALALFNDRFEAGQIAQILYSKPSPEIAVILANRRKMLQTMIDLFDIQVSPRNFTKEAVASLQKDFIRHILIIVDNMPETEHIGNIDTVKESFKQARSILGFAI